jgi:hypothetical protein
VIGPRIRRRPTVEDSTTIIGFESSVGVVRSIVLGEA